MNKKIEKKLNQIFKNIVNDYEREKMMLNGGYVEKTTAKEFLASRW